MWFTLWSFALAAPSPVVPDAPEAEDPPAWDAELPPVLDPAAVPVWPDMRRFRRHPDATLVGLAIGTVGGIVLAAALPDRGRVCPFWSCTVRVVRP